MEVSSAGSQRIAMRGDANQGRKKGSNGAGKKGWEKGLGKRGQAGKKGSNAKSKGWLGKRGWEKGVGLGKRGQTQNLKI